MMRILTVRSWLTLIIPVGLVAGLHAAEPRHTKRLLLALKENVDKYEEKFGKIELSDKGYDPPLALYIKGALEPRDKHAVAIVGSRQTTYYGLETARKLAYQLAFAGVTVVSGVPLAGEALEELATRLKKRCGSGGTVHDGVIEIQGDHRDALVAELGKLGYAVKRSGG